MKTFYFILPLLFLFPILGNAQVEFNAAIERKIDSLFMEYEGEAGAAAAVFHQGKVLYQKGFGIANLENDVKVTPQSVFETGAVAMHFTATAILLLESEGKLSLDDPIQKHLTTFPKYKKGVVTIRHCFHHSSGLRDYLDLIKMTGRSQHIDFDNKAGFELLQKQKELTIVPGSDYRYSHSNYLALALIVEQVSGMSIGEFAKQKIFKPLGMNNTFYYEDNEKVIKNRALLYGKVGEEFKLKQNFDFTACGDGRLYSTVEDMTKWMANFSASKIGGAEKFMEKLFTRGVLNNGTEMSYALGLEYADVKGRAVLGHNGWFGGATAMFLHTPEEGLSVVAMGNHTGKGAIGKAVTINRLLLKERNTPTKAAAPIATSSNIKISEAEKKKFCGAYFSYAIGYDYKIYLKDGELYLHDGEHDDSKLLAIGKNEFRRMHGSNRTTIKFGEEGDRKALFLRYGQRPPITMLEFQPAKLTEEQLQRFTGKYRSEELGVTYDLKIKDRKLQVFLGEKQIVQFDPLMADLFNSDHDGYLKFEKGSKQEILKFTINDYSLGNMSFFKI